MKNALKLAAIPSLMFLAAISVAFAAGFRGTRIDSHHYQFLDTVELWNNPLDSLLYLHSQPPLLNVLLAVIIKLRHFFGIFDRTVPTIAFLLAGLVGAILFFMLIRRMTGSAVQAALGVFVLLANPAYHVFGNLFFYPFILQALFLTLFFLIAKYVEEDSMASLCLLILTIAAITNMRSLFHPVWAICLYLLVTGFKKYISMGFDKKTIASENAAPTEPREMKSRRNAVGLAALLLLLSIWPLKNYLVFGQFTYSSLSGYNLAHYLPIEPVSTITEPVSTIGQAIVRDVAGGESEEVKQYLASFRPVFGITPPKVLTERRKSDGSLNWNHAAFLLSAKTLKERGIRWRLSNPGEYMKMALVHYFVWTSPSTMHPYTQKTNGPKRPHYQGYVRAYNKLLCADMRGFIERLTPRLTFHETARVIRRPVRYTFYGLIFFPTVIISAFVFIALNLKRKRALEAVVAAGIFCHMFAMVVVCLTDGQEGNRMSFSTFPAVIMMTGYSISQALAAIRSKTGLSRENAAAASHSGIATRRSAR